MQHQREQPTSPEGDERRIYLIQQLADEEIEPVDEWDGIRVGDGTESPEATSAQGPRAVVRTFGFLDLCESTAYFEDMGAREALEIVSTFRSVVREVCAKRGVRVAKWIGDGAMLVSVASGPAIAACVEICDKMRDQRLQVRGGVAVSVALPFDGDDYLGRGANFAARLCDASNEGEVLCDVDCRDHIPGWVTVRDTREIEVRGMGTHQVYVLRRGR